MFVIRKQCVSLIEMIVVILLIALILGFAAYNYSSTLEDSKAKITRASIEKVENILSIAIAQNPELADEVDGNWKEVLKTSPLVKDPEAESKDAWGNEYDVTIENGIITVRSSKLDAYQRERRSSRR